MVSKLIGATTAFSIATGAALADDAASPEQIKEPIETSVAFNGNAENQTWAIRYGAEPVDAHAMSITNDRGETREPGWTTITAGDPIGGFGLINHNYIEIGTVDKNGEFTTLKRVQALGIDDNLSMANPADARLVGFVIDGKYNTFENDDMIQQDDPHHEKPNQLQHADDGPLIMGDDYTKIVFEGSEREVLEIYSSMVHGTLELNNQDIDFGLFRYNSNTFNTEMKEKAEQTADQLGIKLGEHDAPWSDIGYGNRLETSESTVHTWDSIEDLRNYVDRLEQAAASQWDTIQENGIDIDLETNIPTQELKI